MFGIHPFRFASRALPGQRIVPPDVAAGAHWAVGARAGVNDDFLHGGTAVGERLVDRAFEFDRIAAAPAAVGGDYEPRARIFDAILDGVGGKAAEYHRGHGADARTGLHGNHGFRNPGHVNHDPIAAPNARILERICKPAHLAVQLSVGQPAHVARLTLEHDRGLPAAIAQMHIQAIVRHVQLTVGEPAVVGRPAVVQGHREGPVPIDLCRRQIRPEADIVIRGLCVHVVQVAGLEHGVVAQLRGRLKHTVLLQHGLNVFLSHRPAPPASIAGLSFIYAPAAIRRACCRKILPNPCVSKKKSSPAPSGCRGLRSSSVASSGMSHTMPVNRRARYAASLCASSLAAIAAAPRNFINGMRWRFAYNSSSEPNTANSSAAVFLPTPGTPGILSTLSPVSAKKSAMSSGVAPKRGPMSR